MKTILLLILVGVLPACAVHRTTFQSDFPAIAAWGQEKQLELAQGQKCPEGTKRAVIEAEITELKVHNKGRQTSHLSVKCK